MIDVPYLQHVSSDKSLLRGTVEESKVVMRDDLRAYMDRIIESEFLGRGARRPALLAYLLRMEAANEGDRIKAYSIGIDVFGKPTDFDPTTDSSVRVEVGRLRAAIAVFEASEWADTAIKVEIPVGTYQPTITKRDIGNQDDALTATSENSVDKQPLLRRHQISLTVVTVFGLAAMILVAAFLVFDWRAASRASSTPITLVVEEFRGDLLGMELKHLIEESFSNHTVVELLTRSRNKVDDGDFVVRGQVRNMGDVSFVIVELVNLGKEKIEWSHSFQFDPAGNLKDVLDVKLNGELETRLIGEAKVMLEERDIRSLTPEQLFILATWVSGPAVSSLEWETERVALMTRALDKDPDFGPAHSVLADKYGFLANMHPDWDTAENLELATFHAARAVELSPLDPNAMFNVAQSYWHLGRHRDSQRIFRRVLELDSGNSLARFFARVVPYWCAPVPDVVMAWALDFDANLSRDDPIRWIVLTWIATLHTNRQEYDLALRAAIDGAQIFQVGYTYMSHAMLLNKAQRPNAARKVFESQTQNWPGINAESYAGSTVPRLCTEQAEAQTFINDYVELADALTKEP